MRRDRSTMGSDILAHSTLRLALSGTGNPEVYLKARCMASREGMASHIVLVLHAVQVRMQMRMMLRSTAVIWETPWNPL